MECPCLAVNASKSLEEYADKWEPLIRLDGSYNAVTDGTSIFMNNMKIFWGQRSEYSILEVSVFPLSKGNANAYRPRH